MYNIGQYNYIIRYLTAEAGKDGGGVVGGGAATDAVSFVYGWGATNYICSSMVNTAYYLIVLFG